MFCSYRRAAAWCTTLLVLVGCHDTPVAPESAGCGQARLTPTVQQGDPLILDWDPSCGVALLLIEAVGGSDAWQIRSAAWDDQAAAPSSTWNTIHPPVKYGVTPQGAEAEDYIGPEPLVAGDYTLTLFRFLDSGVYVVGVPFTVK